jgi:hypothetical protein
MANSSGWLGGDSRITTILSRGVGVAWALVMASVLIVAARDRHPEFASRHGCGTDPLDFLRPGEVLDSINLRFIVHAHCSNARYLSDERIALPYFGGNVDVETRRLDIGGETYYEIVSVGGVAMP